MEFPEELADRYEPLGPLGRGGMSVVFRARQRALGREVALKVFAPHANDGNSRQRFMEEGMLAARIRHPNVCAIFECGETGDGQQFLVYELVMGRTFGVLIMEDLPPAARALELMALVLRGVQAIHDVGVLHRDLKPDNIMLGADGRPRILDFGLARPVHRENRLTESGVVVGTVGFISPEVLVGEPATPASDIYAAGATLFALLTGQPPFPAEDPMHVMGQHLMAAPPDVREHAGTLTEEVAMLVKQSLAKTPLQRPASAAAFADALEAAAAQLAGPERGRNDARGASHAREPRDAQDAREPRRTRRRRAARRLPVPSASAAAGAALALAVTVGLVVAWSARPGRELDRRGGGAMSQTAEQGMPASGAASAAPPQVPASAAAATRVPLDSARQETARLFAACLNARAVSAANASALARVWTQQGTAQLAPGFAMLAHALSPAPRDPGTELALGELHLALGEPHAATDRFQVAHRDARDALVEDRAAGGLERARAAASAARVVAATAAGAPGAPAPSGAPGAFRTSAADDLRERLTRVGATRAAVTTQGRRRELALAALDALPALRVPPREQTGWGVLSHPGDLAHDLAVLIDEAPPEMRPRVGAWLEDQQDAGTTRPVYWELRMRAARSAAEADLAVLRGGATAILSSPPRAAAGTTARSLCLLLHAARRQLGDAAGPTRSNWKRLDHVDRVGELVRHLETDRVDLASLGNIAKRIGKLRSALVPGHDPLVAQAAALLAALALESIRTEPLPQPIEALRDRVQTLFQLALLECDFLVLSRPAGNGLLPEEAARLDSLHLLLVTRTADRLPGLEAALFQLALRAQPETLASFDHMRTKK